MKPRTATEMIKSDKKHLECIRYRLIGTILNLYAKWLIKQIERIIKKGGNNVILAKEKRTERN